MVGLSEVGPGCSFVGTSNITVYFVQNFTFPRREIYMLVVLGEGTLQVAVVKITGTPL